MKTYIDIVHDFQLLESRARMGVPLYEQEEAERSGLVSLLRGERDGDLVQRAWPRLAAPMTARFSDSRRFSTARLRNISGGGLALGSSTPPAPGSELLVYLDDASRALRYLFPVRVAWRDLVNCTLGAAFSGIPSRVSTTDARARRVTPSGVFCLLPQTEAEAPAVIVVGEGR